MREFNSQKGGEQMRKLTPAEMVTALRICAHVAAGGCDNCPIYGECDQINMFSTAADMIEKLAGQKEPGTVVIHAKIKGIGEAVETVQGIADKINAAISLADDLAAKLGSLKVDVE
jgi:hypothetical protein